MSEETLPTLGGNGNGRDLSGRFAPGNKLSRGNPFAQEMNKYRVALYESITPTNVSKIAQKQVAAAEEGDIKAATLIFSLLGLLKQQIEADVTTTNISPEEAKERIAIFFGIRSQTHE